MMGQHAKLHHPYYSAWTPKDAANSSMVSRFKHPGGVALLLSINMDASGV